MHSVYSKEHPDIDVVYQKGITPLSEKDAKAIAAKYLTGDEYEAIFGTVEE